MQSWQTRRRVLERRAGQAGDADAHVPISSIDDVDGASGARRPSARGSRPPGAAPRRRPPGPRLPSASSRWSSTRTPSSTLMRTAPWRGQPALDQPGDALDLARRVGRVAGEHVAGDARVCLPSGRILGRARSPPAARGSGTGRTSCRGRPRRAASPPAAGRGRGCSVQRMCASRSRPPGQGRQIWPACRWPERTRSNAPFGQPVDHVREVAEQDPQVGALGPPAARAATRRRRNVRGSTPAIWTRRPRSSIVRESSVSSVAGSRSAHGGRMRERVAGRARSRGCRARRSSAAAARAAPAAAARRRGARAGRR